MTYDDDENSGDTWYRNFRNVECESKGNREQCSNYEKPVLLESNIESGNHENVSIIKFKLTIDLTTRL